MTVHDRTRLIGQFHLFIKPASAGFCFRFGGFLLIWPVKGIEVAEDASVTIRQLIDSRGDIILFVFVMRNTKRYGLRSF
ncbi:hypothetical protein AIJ47_10095 [Salmonella enterica subsp. enterica serovar Enteritidis]|nr:hypothetical protein AIJ47_10095 [Salmonella enterica subsp. enterica serovar Enteritidis]